MILQSLRSLNSTATSKKGSKSWKHRLSYASGSDVSEGGSPFSSCRISSNNFNPGRPSAVDEEVQTSDAHVLVRAHTHTHTHTHAHTHTHTDNEHPVAEHPLVYIKPPQWTFTLTFYIMLHTHTQTHTHTYTHTDNEHLVAEHPLVYLI
jgi:hypothetical protein